MSSSLSDASLIASPWTELNAEAVGVEQCALSDPRTASSTPPARSRCWWSGCTTTMPSFSDLAPTGPEGRFSGDDVDNICQLLDLITARAMGAEAA